MTHTTATMMADADAATPPDNRAELLSIHREQMALFRFYIALTVFANLGYALVIGAYVIAVILISAPFAVVLLIVPGMVSTGFAALSAFGVAEAISLHHAIQKTGEALSLPHTSRSLMLPVQTILTLIFHALLAFVLFGTVFFTAIGVLPAF